MLMSDETDVNCRRFIELDGLDIFQQCLEVRLLCHHVQHKSMLMPSALSLSGKIARICCNKNVIILGIILSILLAEGHIIFYCLCHSCFECSRKK